MCLDHLWAVRGPFQGLSRASTVRLKFPVFPLRYRSISSVWSSFLHLLLLLTVFLYIPKASNFPRSAPGNTQKPDSLPIPTYSRILNGSIFTYKWPFKFPRCLSQKTFTLCIWNNIWAVYIWNLLTRNDTVFIWSVENVLKKGEWKWSKKDNHIHKVPSKKMFCVRNSPTLTPSHSWKQLWTNKSSNTKGWNMLKNKPENAWKRKLIQNADSMLVFKWKTTNVKTTNSPLIETVSRPSILGLHSYVFSCMGRSIWLFLERETGFWWLCPPTCPCQPMSKRFSDYRNWVPTINGYRL